MNNFVQNLLLSMSLKEGNCMNATEMTLHILKPQHDLNSLQHLIFVQLTDFDAQ